MADASTEYRIYRGEPFLRYDWSGKPVILCEETVRSINAGTDTYTSYSVERLINDNPSEAEIFKYRLKQGI
ncbi:hypothetical protein KAR91_18515 [Candidatus Pacearchaeota archaeon]|nr:hypothetical protein [Candidatus Pacearchaeota archaeon]